ncbi:isoleucine--tRNA ligase [Candidatus Pacearchaeota archaeon CG10_big_fil_rev_8_21_14_0_10_32_14]|nr:MAG: isoleucine--tRNA ligase [Candidatus Pacearchaeota archaeon CG10_big_fil_rev_8_21_14_0_10_32_14]
MYDFKINEAEILKYWKENKVYNKAKVKNSKGKKFYMMDGPPYATGHIHMGTALNKILKDIAMRSRRQQGFDVFDRPGYDTHGVPIEFQIEKEIGSKTKKDIETYGVKKFIEKCKTYATQHIGIMNSEFINLGVWMDFDNPYLTLDQEYIETIWDTFKKAHEDKLLYLGKYPVHICSRCETAVAYNEIEYSKQDDTAVYVKFPVKGEKNKFLIIWTTTPWTLPGNTGIMANPDLDYVEIELSNGEHWIMGKEKVSELMSAIESGFTIKKEFKGKELNGIKYESPLKNNIKINVKNGYRVVLSSRYVNMEEGSGLVHCAPGHGKEDYEVGKENGLDIISPVSMNGLLTNETGKYSGKKARVVDKEIIEDLKEDNFLVYKHIYSHDYPLCWRCKSPLLMVSIPQWFFKIDKVQPKLISSNEKVDWHPKYMKLRMKAWLEGISDWPISRNRYWGTPLPIWMCDSKDCDEKVVVGSVKELEKISSKKVKEIHKPEIDEITWKCKKCDGKMKRVSEVLDVWFDSGVSSWAALNYPREDKLFKKFWPADLNLEGKDQVRGWWNSEIILSQMRYGKKPFESILVHGMVLDLGKKKMSKSLGNIISPQEIIEKYGRDYLRYYFAKISRGEDFSFDENEFKKIRQTFTILENVIKYTGNLGGSEKGKFRVEDKWILSKFNFASEEITKAYNNYDFSGVIELYEQFLVNDFSRTYIKIVRDRESEKVVKDIIENIVVDCLKLISPICPFITEFYFRDKFGKSIHLSDWSKVEKKKIDKKIDEEMRNVMEIVERGLAERDKIKVGLKWPLKSAKIISKNEINKEFLELIKNQLNVKGIEIEVDKKIEFNLVEFDQTMNFELEAEGYGRELSRQIQAFRKKIGLNKSDIVDIYVEITDNKMKDYIESQKKAVAERTNSKNIKIVTTLKETFKNKTSFDIKGNKGMIAIDEK